MNFDIEKSTKKKETPLWVGMLLGAVIALSIASATFYIVSLGDPAVTYRVES